MNLSNLKPLDYRKNPFREDNYSALTFLGLHTVYRHEHNWYFRNPWNEHDKGPYSSKAFAEEAAFANLRSQLATLFN